RWADNFDIMRMILDAGVDDLIFRRFRQYVNRTMGNVLRRREIKVSDPKLIEFIVDHAVGSHFHMIKHWMMEEMPYTPREMAKLYTSLHSFNSRADTMAMLASLSKTS